MPSARIWRCARQKIAGAAAKRTLPPRVLQKGVRSYLKYSKKSNFKVPRDLLFHVTFDLALMPRLEPNRVKLVLRIIWCLVRSPPDARRLTIIRYFMHSVKSLFSLPSLSCRISCRSLVRLR